MSNKLSADVVIVGCGPIGSYAAWQFADRGLKVIALDRKKADQPISDIGAFHFERVAFDRTGVPLPKDEDVICTYPGMTIHAPSSEHELVVRGVETWALELVPFIENLRQLAKDAGAEIHCGQKVVDLIYEDGRIVGVVSESEDGKKEYRATVVVDATGLSRTLRKKVPSMTVPNGDRVFSVYMEYWSDAENPPGDGIHSYLGPNSWTAKYPDYWIVGLGQATPLAQTKQDHAEWVSKMLPGAKTIEKSETGAIPYAYPPPSVVDDGFLIIGDAAGTNKPFNGEGIASGMMLAKIAAEVLPGAVKAGGTKKSLWEINRRYFTGQGAKFALLHAMGLALIDLSEDELNRAFSIGLISAEDLRQTFYDYEIKRPVLQWIGPIARLLTQGAMARKYIAAFYHAAKVAKMFEQYPSLDRFNYWRGKFEKLIG